MIMGDAIKAKKKIGFVSPWYGENIPGGAEAELRGVVHHLQEAGVNLEVLTTCVKRFQDDWNRNYHAPGYTVESEIPVRRFPVRRRNTARFDEVNLKLMNGLSVSEKEEKVFCREMINSPELYKYMKKHEDEYALFVMIPYMFGTTYYGAQICPEKTVLIPCFHDESYAYMKCFRDVFSKVKGMVFNAEPERFLTERLYGVNGENYSTFGIGMDTDWISRADDFRKKYNIFSPFILYAGRKDAGKKVDLLVKYFVMYKRQYPSDLKLVLIGGGNIKLPDRDDIIELGFIDVQDKYNAYGAATLFCNPSQMESFSFVIMESWLAGRPVLVNDKCAVTKDFVRQANGGLYFGNFREFSLCVQFILNHPKEAQQMAENGRSYVKEHFVWDVIVNKYISLFNRIGQWE